MRQTQLEILFGSSFEIRAYYTVKMLSNFDSKVEFLILRTFKFIGSLLDLSKKFRFVKDVRHDKVEEDPEFFKVVAERSTSHKELKAGLKIVESCKIVRLSVFYFVCLVNDQNLPFDL